MTQGNFDEESLRLIGRLSEKLMARNMLMGTAESCTGGLVSTLCTSVPGSSQWFAGAVVSYSNSVKSHLLAVDEGLIIQWGAVSEPVAMAMAKGGLCALGVDICVAISGIAGPDGGTPEKPVGTVCFATALKQKDADAHTVNSFVRHFPGDRAAVRHAAAIVALRAVEEALGAVSQ